MNVRPPLLPLASLTSQVVHDILIGQCATSEKKKKWEVGLHAYTQICSNVQLQSDCSLQVVGCLETRAVSWRSQAAHDRRRAQPPVFHGGRAPPD